MPAVPGRVSPSPRNGRVEEILAELSSLFAGSAPERPDERVEDFSSAAPTSDGSAASDRDIVLDVEMNGYRCVLIRRDSSSAASQLSPRELEIARLVAKGYGNKMIAAVLDISGWTVNTHLRRIFSKLGITSRAAMVAKLGAEKLLA